MTPENEIREAAKELQAIVREFSLLDSDEKHFAIYNQLRDFSSDFTAKVHALEASPEGERGDGKGQDYGPTASASEVVKPDPSPRVAKWQPISSAPKDGTRIMAWQAPWEVPSQVYCLDDHHASGEPEGWFTVGGHRPINPTHWMPLPEPPAATPDTEKCEDCYAYHQDDALIRHETCDRPNCPGKANPSPPTQPDRPTGTIFELDLFRERMERKAANERLVVEPMTGEEAAAHIGNTLEALAAELKTLIDNCMKQYVNPSPPITPDPIQGEGSWKIVRRPSKVDGYLDRWFVCGDVEIQLDAWMKDEAEPGSHPEKWVMGHGEKDLIELASAAYQAGANSTGEGPYKDGDEMTVKLAGEDYTFPLHGNAVIAANVGHQAGASSTNQQTFDHAKAIGYAQGLTDGEVASSKDQVVEAAAEVSRLWYGASTPDLLEQAHNNLAAALNPNSETEK